MNLAADDERDIESPLISTCSGIALLAFIVAGFEISGIIEESMSVNENSQLPENRHKTRVSEVFLTDENMRKSR